MSKKVSSNLKQTTKAVTNTRLALATAVLFLAGGLAFMAFPWGKSFGNFRLPSQPVAQEGPVCNTGVSVQGSYKECYDQNVKGLQPRRYKAAVAICNGEKYDLPQEVDQKGNAVCIGHIDWVRRAQDFCKTNVCEQPEEAAPVCAGAGENVHDSQDSVCCEGLETDRSGDICISRQVSLARTDQFVNGRDIYAGSQDATFFEFRMDPPEEAVMYELEFEILNATNEEASHFSGWTLHAPGNRTVSALPGVIDPRVRFSIPEGITFGPASERIFRLTADVSPEVEDISGLQIRVDTGGFTEVETTIESTALDLAELSSVTHNVHAVDVSLARVDGFSNLRLDAGEEDVLVFDLIVNSNVEVNIQDLAFYFGASANYVNENSSALESSSFTLIGPGPNGVGEEVLGAVTIGEDEYMRFTNIDTVINPDDANKHLKLFATLSDNLASVDEVQIIVDEELSQVLFTPEQGQDIGVPFEADDSSVFSIDGLVDEDFQLSWQEIPANGDAQLDVRNNINGRLVYMGQLDLRLVNPRGQGTIELREMQSFGELVASYTVEENSTVDVISFTLPSRKGRLSPPGYAGHGSSGYFVELNGLVVDELILESGGFYWGERSDHSDMQPYNSASLPIRTQVNL